MICVRGYQFSLAFCLACALLASLSALRAEDELVWLNRPAAEELERPWENGGLSDGEGGMRLTWIQFTEQPNEMHSDEAPRDEWPNIEEPGPDLGDYPNSAFTLPRGRCYLEMAPLTYSAGDPYTSATYSWPYLFRYGITDDVEFRFLGAGLTSVAGSQGATGIAPLIFDLKVHLWDQLQDWWIPATSLEVYIQTDWASPVFQGGTQPSVNMNCDYRLTEQTNVEWTVSYTGVRDTVDVVTGRRFTPRIVQQAELDTQQFAFQWAIEREVSDTVQVFVHGYYNGAVLFQQGDGTAIGAGIFWKLSDRLMAFGSYNVGIDHDVPPGAGQVGFALAL